MHLFFWIEYGLVAFTILAAWGWAANTFGAQQPRLAHCCRSDFFFFFHLFWSAIVVRVIQIYIIFPYLRVVDCFYIFIFVVENFRQDVAMNKIKDMVGGTVIFSSLMSHSQSQRNWIRKCDLKIESIISPFFFIFCLFVFIRICNFGVLLFGFRWG